jgi:two-component system, sensor histidine kinase
MSRRPARRRGLSSSSTMSRRSARRRRACSRAGGHRVIAAGSGDEAIERLSSSSVRPDLLICDYRLRGEESGGAVIERLRSGYKAIPAVLITGDTTPSRLAEAEASGLLLLHKPVAKGKLRAAIANLKRSGGR